MRLKAVVVLTFLHHCPVVIYDHKTGEVSVYREEAEDKLPYLRTLLKEQDLRVK